MGDTERDDPVVAALKAEAIDLTRRLSAMPDLVARRREVVRLLVDRIGVARTAETIGISRQAVYRLVRD